MAEEVNSFTFSSSGSVESKIVSICDLNGVDNAVFQLCMNHIIGVDVLWQPELVRKSFHFSHKEVGEYHPISVLTLCSGNKSFSFQVPRDSVRLPMAIRLLLTHNDYTKVFYSARNIKIGKLFRDFDVKVG